MSTIHDIAKAAGVSPASVSKALNGYKDVKEATRRRILSIAEELDYSPNRSAVQLVRSSADTIGVILSMIGGPYSHDEYLLGIISGIYHFAEGIGFRGAMFTAQTIEKNKQNYVQFCRSNNLIGSVIHGFNKDDPNVSHLVNSEVPCVFIDNDIEGKCTATISVDNEKASAEVVDKLAGLGHTHICFVSGPKESTAAYDRLKGYMKGIARNNTLEPHVIHSNFLKADAYEQVKAYIFNHPGVTAFFCASDLMAVGALNACQDLQYKVPDDVSIVGFDNLSFTTHVRPELSTVCQDFFNMGQKAASLLLDIHKGKAVLKHVYLDYEIIMRQSVAKNKRR